MQDETRDWIAVRDWTVALVDEAADRARAMVAAGISADMKTNGTVVTDVDRTIEQFLRKAIMERFPDHAILGEEFDSVGEFSPDVPLWCLDPVDGTTNLANGLPIWCISVGVVYQDRPVVGVLNAPMMRDVYVAAIDAGATRNGVPLALLGAGGELHNEEAYIICSTSVRTMDFSRLTAKLRLLGSAALDLCYVASGQARGCQCVGTSLYDVAAGMCITEAVGAPSIWLETGAPYSVMEHLAEGSDSSKTLVTAPPATLVYLREHL